MGNVLKELEVKKVDFVDEGANQDANIKLYKKKELKDGSDPGVDSSSLSVTIDEQPFIKRLADSIAKRFVAAFAGTQQETEELEKSKDTEGEMEEVLKIDKSKMSEQERAAYDEIIKKYAIEAPDEDVEKKKGADDEDIEKKKVDPEDNEDEIEEETEEKKKSREPAQKRKGDDGTDDDIYKGLHPAVAEEIKSLRKFKQDIEDRDIMEVAKKYEAIGKKPEELAVTLKSLKAAGGTAYDDMISLLDQTVEMQEQSGMFREIGKSGHGSGGIQNSLASVSKIESIAKNYVEKDPDLDYTDAVTKAWENNPELMDEYEQEAGF